MSVLKGKKEKEALYQTASVVLRELVDLDLGFIIMLILKKGDRKRKREREMLKSSSDQYLSAGFPQRFWRFLHWLGRLPPASALSVAGSRRAFLFHTQAMGSSEGSSFSACLAHRGTGF